MVTAVRMTKRHEPEVGAFADALLEAMAKKGISIGDLSEGLGSTYEHVRKLTKSMAFPSKLMLEKICKIVGMNYGETEKLVVGDKLKHKYGNIPQELSGKNPRFEVIERDLPKLTEDQFKTLGGIIKGMIQANRS